jgi:hypothetical protein
MEAVLLQEEHAAVVKQQLALEPYQRALLRGDTLWRLDDRRVVLVQFVVL